MLNFRYYLERWLSRFRQPDGPAEGLHDNGEIGFRGSFRDGKEEGPWEFYHPNGQLEIECTYRNGERDGPWRI